MLNNISTTHLAKNTSITFKAKNRKEDILLRECLEKGYDEKKHTLTFPVMNFGDILRSNTSDEIYQQLDDFFVRRKNEKSLLSR